MKSAIVCPVHLKHKEYAVEFLRTFREHYGDNDIFIVFHDEADVDVLRKAANNDPFHAVVVPGITTPILQGKPISTKKIYGTKHVFDNYPDIDYVGVVDCDMIFTSTKDYDKLFHESCERSTYWFHRVSNDGVNNKLGKETAEKFLTPPQQMAIEQMSDNYMNFWWFNDLPVYSRKHFKGFLDFIDWENTMYTFKYIHFDYVLYVWYLFLQGACKFRKIEGAGTTQRGYSFIERQRDHPKDVWEGWFRKAKPMWILDKIAEKDMSNVFMQIHRNR